MEKAEILALNRAGWDRVTEQFTGVTALPIYGPLIPTEDELCLFEGIEGAAVLEVGCGDGYSMKYMADRGASEIHGLDLSPEQISKARNFLDCHAVSATLHCSPMEVDTGMPKDHFDIAYSIYALGWSTDLLGTLALIHSYLKPGGYYIFSWEHPFFSCLEAQGLKVGVSKPYLPEVADHNAKWRGSGGVVMHRRSMSTYLNALISAGFVLERIVEPPMPGEFHADACKPDVKWYSPLKAGLITTTFIVKARKPA